MIDCLMIGLNGLRAWHLHCESSPASFDEEHFHDNFLLWETGERSGIAI